MSRRAACLRWRKDTGPRFLYGDGMEDRELSMDMTVEEALDRWPALARVFVRRRMACVGCAMARFERLSDVARIYGASPDALRAALRRALPTSKGRR
jgi:hybrid cluster-associated redox disulfide protein